MQRPMILDISVIIAFSCQSHTLVQREAALGDVGMVLGEALQVRLGSCVHAQATLGLDILLAREKAKEGVVALFAAL